MVAGIGIGIALLTLTLVEEKTEIALVGPKIVGLTYACDDQATCAVEFEVRCSLLCPEVVSVIVRSYPAPGFEGRRPRLRRRGVAAPYVAGSRGLSVGTRQLMVELEPGRSRSVTTSVAPRQLPGPPRHWVATYVAAKIVP